MSSAKHSNDFIDPNRTYEENTIRLKGIIGFAIGLFLLIVVTFGLMWMLLGAMEDNAKQNADPVNPMVMNERDRLPPEPRLQLAPGFGVESERGWVNLELREPAAEYLELERQWKDIWKNGQKDKKTGIISVMPIEAAKQRFLAGSVKAKSGPEADKSLMNSRMIVSDSSAGRLATESRR